jgi:hypothetical protein
MSDVFIDDDDDFQRQLEEEWAKLHQLDDDAPRSPIDHPSLRSPSSLGIFPSSSSYSSSSSSADSISIDGSEASLGGRSKTGGSDEDTFSDIMPHQNTSWAVLSGHVNQMDVEVPKLSQVALPGWTGHEINAFFRGLRRYSRWMPEAISQSIGTKSTAQVLSYIERLQQVTLEFKDELPVTRQNNRIHVKEVSDADALKEEQLAELQAQEEDRQLEANPKVKRVRRALAKQRVLEFMARDLGPQNAKVNLLMHRPMKRAVSQYVTSLVATAKVFAQVRLRQAASAYLFCGVDGKQQHPSAPIEILREDILAALKYMEMPARIDDVVVGDPYCNSIC